MSSTARPSLTSKLLSRCERHPRRRGRRSQPPPPRNWRCALLRWPMGDWRPRCGTYRGIPAFPSTRINSTSRRFCAGTAVRTAIIGSGQSLTADWPRAAVLEHPLAVRAAVERGKQVAAEDHPHVEDGPLEQSVSKARQGWQLPKQQDKGGAG